MARSRKQIVLLFDGRDYTKYDDQIFLENGDCYIARLIKKELKTERVSVDPFYVSINGERYKVYGDCGRERYIQAAIEKQMAVPIVLNKV